jgi:hypothetical protein
MIARVIIDGPPIHKFLNGRRMEAAAERVLTRTFRAWPSDQYAKFVITPGGFLKSELPAGLSGYSGWNSVSDDFSRIRAAAELTIRRVVTNRVLTSATGKAECLTIGIDLTSPTGLQHAELVALIRCADGRILRWTGKSYPTAGQERTLIQVTNLESHCISVRGERVLILGCHDLNMFSPRGWSNQNKKGKRRQRCDAMRSVASKFRPTVILQHPHGTDSPRIWLLPWRYLERTFKSSMREWASGICFYYKKGKRQRSVLRKVLDKTRHPKGLEFVFTTRGRKIIGPALL